MKINVAKLPIIGEKCQNKGQSDLKKNYAGKLYVEFL